MAEDSRSRRTIRPADLIGPRHPRDLVCALITSVTLAIGALLTQGGKVGAVERRVFRFVNRLPGALEIPLTAVMQAGTLAAVVVVAAVCLLTRRIKLALHVTITGIAAWNVAKLLKTAVGRGRPDDLLTDVVIRGGHVAGFGFPSGHAAVAAAIAGALTIGASRRARCTVAGVAFLVGIARMYVGAHFPLDVVGGLALGTLLASAVNLALGRPEPPLRSRLQPGRPHHR